MKFFNTRCSLCDHIKLIRDGNDEFESILKPVTSKKNYRDKVNLSFKGTYGVILINIRETGNKTILKTSTLNPPLFALTIYLLWLKDSIVKKK